MNTAHEEQKLLVAVFGPRYRGSREEVLSEWWRRQTELFQQLEVQITHITGCFLKKPQRLSENKAYSYRRYRRRFEEELSQQNLRSLSLNAMNAKPEGYMAFDWDASCGLMDDEGYGALSEVGVDMRHVGKLCDAPLLALLRDLLLEQNEFIETVYGFCTVMPRSFMPIGYTLAIMASEAPAMLISDANVWSKWVRRECARHLRNVFAVNVLNKSHLDLLVGQERLVDWIRARPERGELTDLDGGLILWSLLLDESGVNALRWDAPRVQAVRGELMKHDFFPWQKER